MDDPINYGLDPDPDLSHGGWICVAILAAALILGFWMGAK